MSGNRRRRLHPSKTAAGAGAGAPGSSGAPDRDRAVFLLQLSSAKVENLEKALEKNWIAHLVLAGIGVALVCDIGELPRVFARYFGQDQYDIKPGAAILLPTILYYFMKFGHLLAAFILARSLHDKTLSAYLGESVEGREVTPLRETTSFFEVFYSPRSFAGPVVIAYFAVTPAVISLAQAAALFLIFRAYGANPWSIAAAVTSGTVLLVLYGGFWNSQKNHPGTTPVVVGSIALVIFWLCLFAALAPPSPAKSTTPRGGTPGTLTIKSLVTAAISASSSG